MASEEYPNLGERTYLKPSHMLAIAQRVLGPQFDEQNKSKPRWYVVEDRVSRTGLAVTDGSDNYFVYGKSNFEPRDPKAKILWGLKRVIFGENGLKQSVASVPIRRKEDEFQYRASNYRPKKKE